MFANLSSALITGDWTSALAQHLPQRNGFVPKKGHEIDKCEILKLLSTRVCDLFHLFIFNSITDKTKKQRNENMCLHLLQLIFFAIYSVNDMLLQLPCSLNTLLVDWITEFNNFNGWRVPCERSCVGISWRGREAGARLAWLGHSSLRRAQSLSVEKI